MHILDFSLNTSSLVLLTDTGKHYCPIEKRSDDYYFFFKKQWHRASEYMTDDLKARLLSHTPGVQPNRVSITQEEFEYICKQVLSKHSDITGYSFEEPGILHVTYPSHSGKTTNGSVLFFGEKGYITCEGWTCRIGSNRGYFIGKEISQQILYALFNRDSINGCNS